MLTVDFDRSACALASGCSTSAAAPAGTPSSACAAALVVVALDAEPVEVKGVVGLMAAMVEAGEVPSRRGGHGP